MVALYLGELEVGEGGEKRRWGCDIAGLSAFIHSGPYSEHLQRLLHTAENIAVYHIKSNNCILFVILFIFPVSGDFSSSEAAWLETSRSTTVFLGLQ